MLVSEFKRRFIAAMLKHFDDNHIVIEGASNPEWAERLYEERCGHRLPGLDRTIVSDPEAVAADTFMLLKQFQDSAQIGGSA
jgi:hypothetical protein